MRISLFLAIIAISNAVAVPSEAQGNKKLQQGDTGYVAETLNKFGGGKEPKVLPVKTAEAGELEQGDKGYVAQTKKKFGGS